MRYIYSPGTDPAWNLALEQYIFDRMDRGQAYFMLWQNANTIVVGRHQNTAAEINEAFVQQRGIQVVRRLSGGGAVYHDLGNLNYTFIADQESKGVDFSAFCTPVIRALATLGVTAELSGRNDMTIDGKKFSGNSLYKRQGRVTQHGTILYDSDLQILSQALRVSGEKLAGKGVQSVAARVTNIKPYMTEDRPIGQLVEALHDFMDQEYGLEDHWLGEADLAAVERLRQERYGSWAWNYGQSPRYGLHKQRRIEGCGTVELFVALEQERVADIQFFGDFFTAGDLQVLRKSLKGCRLQRDEIRAALATGPMESYIHGLSNETFLTLLLD